MSRLRPRLNHCFAWHLFEGVDVLVLATSPSNPRTEMRKEADTSQESGGFEEKVVRPAAVPIALAGCSQGHGDQGQ